MRDLAARRAFNAALAGGYTTTASPTKKQRRRQKLTRRQEINRALKPESSFYNVYDVAQYNPERAQDSDPSPRSRLDSLASLGKDFFSRGLSSIMSRFGFENPSNTFLESETKHDIHGYCRLGWVERPRKANDVVKALFDSTNFEIKRSRTGGIMDVRPKKAMMDLMQDGATWLSHLTYGTNRPQDAELFEVLASLLDDEPEEETDWFETEVVDRLPLKTTDVDYISAMTYVRRGESLPSSVLVQPYGRSVVTSRDREEFRDSVVLDYDVRKELYDSLKNTSFHRKIAFNRSQFMWAGLSLEDDSTTFNLVYEWMVNENMFNDFIPMKDGKQVILPSFQLQYRDIPDKNWEPSSQQVRDVLPTIYKYMRKNGRCQFGLGMYLEDSGHAVVLVFEDNKVYACDSNGTSFQDDYPFTTIVKNIMNAFIKHSDRLEYGGVLGELNPGCHNASKFQLYGGVCASWAKYLLLLLSINPHVKAPAIFDYHAVKGYTDNYLINRAILIVLYLFEHSLEGLLDPRKHTSYLRSLRV